MSEPPTSLHRAKSHDVLEAARSWLDKDGRIALATVIGTWGSAPVGIGGQLVIAADGRFEGSVSGGCVEGEVITEAEDIMASGKPKTLSSASPTRRPGRWACPAAARSRFSSSGWTRARGCR